MAEKEKKNGVSWGTTIRPRSANPFICLPDVKGKAPESHLLLHTICFPLHHTKRTTLKKLQKKFISFAVEVDKDADNFPLCEKLYKTFLQEMTTFELPLLKSRAVIEANLREKNNFNELQEGLHRQILQAQRDIEDLKRQLEESKIQRKHKEECETIRRLVAMQPPRSETQKMINELEKEIGMLEAENTAGSRTLELRKKQFSLLFHVVDELQNTIEDEQKSLAEELRIAMEEQKDSGGAEAMAVD